MSYAQQHGWCKLTPDPAFVFDVDAQSGIGLWRVDILNIANQVLPAVVTNRHCAKVTHLICPLLLMLSPMLALLGSDLQTNNSDFITAHGRQAAPTLDSQAVLAFSAMLLVCDQKWAELAPDLAPVVDVEAHASTAWLADRSKPVLLTVA
jgi:hypothetical protein